jgi:hypothetical protein
MRPTGHPTTTAMLRKFVELFVNGIFTTPLGNSYRRQSRSPSTSSHNSSMTFTQSHDYDPSPSARFYLDFR